MRPGARCGSALLRRSREGDVCSPVPRPRRAVASSPLCCFCLEIAGSSKSRAVSILVNSHSCSARSSGRRSASSRRSTNCRFFVSSLAMIIDVAPPVLVVNLVLRTDVAWHRARASSLPRYCFRSRLRARWNRYRASRHLFEHQTRSAFVAGKNAAHRGSLLESMLFRLML